MSRLLFEWSLTWAAAVFVPWISFFISVMDGLPLSVGGRGASSSGRPPIDLNLPPAPEPASTSDQPQEEVELRRQMEEHLLARLVAKSPPGSNPDLLLKQARETAQLKRQIVDRMPELDPDHSYFWRDQRYRIITDSILTNREQADYAPHRLRQMLNDLSKPDSPTLRKMLKIRKHFQEKVSNIKLSLSFLLVEQLGQSSPMSRERHNIGPSTIFR